MSLQIVTLDRVPAQPWRNGGGVTRELLAAPAGPDWQWRLSVADITRDGPFSAFPGIERWFAVLEGDGVVLHFADRRVMLDADSAPLCFDGAAAPDCTLQGGATRDLNLMLRRGAIGAGPPQADRAPSGGRREPPWGPSSRGSLQRVQADAEWFSTVPQRAVYTVSPARLQIDDADAAQLPAHSLAFSAHAMRQRWRLVADDAPRAWWVEITA